jgi:hypothetical protein
MTQHDDRDGQGERQWDCVCCAAAVGAEMRLTYANLLLDYPNLVERCQDHQGRRMLAL